MKEYFKFITSVLMITNFLGCGLFATRPVQEMTFAEAALRAARDVKADVLAPNLYRESLENYLKSKKFYKDKHFDSAKKFANSAKKLAEEAEFISIRKGGATPETPTESSQPK